MEHTTRSFTLRLEPDVGEIPPKVTLRRVLKLCGAGGLRCVDVREIKPGPTAQEKQMTEQNNGVQMIVRQLDTFMPLMSSAQAIERRNTMVDFVKKVMKPDVDFGAIPGTDQKKKTLLKPGAEELCTLFGLTPRLTLIEKVEDWTGEKHGESFFYYHYRCALFRGEQLIAESEGSCNSREAKYRYRKEERKCPTCGVAAIIKSKTEYGGGWVCFNKRGGCGAKFADDDEQIEGQQVGRVPNPDIADQVNTLQKMAQKRALIGTTLLAVNASEFFATDQEEIADDDDDALRVDANGEPDLMHDRTFLGEWEAELTSRGFGREQVDEVLNDTLTRSNLKLPQARRTWRAGVLNAARQGKFDHLLKKPDAAPAAGPASSAPNDDEVATFEAFVGAAHMAEAEHGHSFDVVDQRIEHALLAAGLKGKPTKTTKAWRREILAAIRVNSFGYSTGKAEVNQVEQALSG